MPVFSTQPTGTFAQCTTSRVPDYSRSRKGETRQKVHQRLNKLCSNSSIVTQSNKNELLLNTTEMRFVNNNVQGKPNTNLCISVSISLSIYLSIYLSIHLSIYHLSITGFHLKSPRQANLNFFSC